MPAPKYNAFWKLRSSHGRKPKFETPEILWNACVEYFDEVSSTPLKASELVKYKGKAKVKKVNKMRAMSIMGLCIFLDISYQAWSEYRAREGYGEVTTRVEMIIKTQKFEGAAAELLNPNIIARDIGLAEKRQVDVTDATIAKAIIDALPAEMQEKVKDAIREKLGK
jgi:hypothetical protein